MKQDTMTSQGFQGFGPQNWNRTDEFIKDDICRRLTGDAQLDATGITVDVNGGEVRIGGYVTDHQSRATLSRLLNSTYGTKSITNAVQVGHPLQQQQHASAGLAKEAPAATGQGRSR